MFYKLLYGIVALIVMLISYYIANGILVAQKNIDTWKNAYETKNFEPLLKWSEKYEKTPIINADLSDCHLEVYQIYNSGIEKIDNKDVDVVAFGYQFLIYNPSESFKYATSQTAGYDGQIVFYYDGQLKNDAGEFEPAEVRVAAGYYTYELNDISVASINVYMTDTSSSLSVVEQFKDSFERVTILPTFKKIEIKDAEGKVVGTVEDFSAQIKSDTSKIETSITQEMLSTWESGYTNEEKDAAMRPATIAPIILTLLIELVIFTGIFALLFLRKKKSRLFLSDSVKIVPNKPTNTIPSSSVSVKDTEDIIDEDKIEDDDVDENSLL